MTCKHDWDWKLQDCNESGWRCINCGEKPGEPPGYSPEHDRRFTLRKVEAVQMALHYGDLAYFSSGDHGEHLAHCVVAKVRASGLYDQWSITRFIFEELCESHARYWKEIGDGIMAGNDPRDRCHCGKLSTCSIGDKRFCSEHVEHEW